MTVKEMIEILEQLPPTDEVRIAYQPNYPLQCAVSCVTPLTGDLDGILDDEDDVRDEDKVWIASGSPTASGYAPREAWLGGDL